MVLTNQAARDAVLPPELQGRPLEDYLVVDALERWAAQQADQILSALFIIAAIVTAIAIVPTLAMHNRPGAMSRASYEEDDEHVQRGRGGVTSGPRNLTRVFPARRRSRSELPTQPSIRRRQTPTG